MTRLRRVAALIAASAAGLIGTVLLTAPEALATVQPLCVRSGCELSGNPSTGGIFFNMPGGTPLTMKCWTDNQWYHGTNRWFKTSSVYGTGYIIATEVNPQTVAGHC